MSELLLKDECYRVIGACFEVYNEMGPGFLEAVYQECLEVELTERSIPFVAQPSLRLYFKDKLLTKLYRPDFYCYQQIIVDLKAKKSLDDIDRAQVINYLKATRMPLAVLVNFCSPGELEYQRLVSTKA